MDVVANGGEEAGSFAIAWSRDIKTAFVYESTFGDQTQLKDYQCSCV
jgi:hypothetical protein